MGRAVQISDFVTNYKILQKTIKTEQCTPIINSNNQNCTSLSPSIYTKKSPIKQDEPKKPLSGPVILKKQPQWNTKYCLATSVLHENYTWMITTLKIFCSKPQQKSKRMLFEWNKNDARGQNLQGNNQHSHPLWNFAFH